MFVSYKYIIVQTTITIKHTTKQLYLDVHSSDFFFVATVGVSFSVIPHHLWNATAETAENAFDINYMKEFWVTLNAK